MPRPRPISVTAATTRSRRNPGVYAVYYGGIPAGYGRKALKKWMDKHRITGRQDLQRELEQAESSIRISSTVSFVSQTNLAKSEELVRSASEPSAFNANIDRVRPARLRSGGAASNSIRSKALTLPDTLTHLDLLLPPDPIISSQSTASGQGVDDESSDDDNYGGEEWNGFDGYHDDGFGGDGFGPEDDNGCSGDGFGSEDSGDGFGTEDDTGGSIEPPHGEQPHGSPPPSPALLPPVDSQFSTQPAVAQSPVAANPHPDSPSSSPPPIASTSSPVSPIASTPSPVSVPTTRNPDSPSSGNDLGLRTPPVSPQKTVLPTTTQLPPTTSTTTSTPTRVGQLLANATAQCLPAQGAPRTLASVFGAREGSQVKSVDDFTREYMQFVRGEQDMKDVDWQAATRYVKRSITVAAYLALELPSQSRSAESKQLMDILFARDQGHIEEIGLAVGKSLEAFVTQFTQAEGVIQHNSPVTHLVYRWIGLSRFSGAVVNPPENLAWLFLFVHQLIYEKIAFEHATECGLEGKSVQQIQQLVNRDLIALTREKFGPNHKPLSKNDFKNNKKSIQFLLTFCGFLVNKICAFEQLGEMKERMTFGILVVDTIFVEVAKRNAGFGEFGAIGSYHFKSQQYFLNLIWHELERHFENFAATIRTAHPGVNGESIRPFMTNSGGPNIFSFFHLVFQSLQHDFPDLQPDIVEEACALPPGFLSTFESQADLMLT